MAMTKTDRKELTSVVRSEFKILRNELRNREMQLASKIRAELEAEAKDATQEAIAAAAALEERADQLERDATALVREMREQGLEPQGYRGSIIRIDFDNRWQAKDIDRRVQQQLNAIKTQRGAAELQLDRNEQDLVKELSVGALETEEAKTFLAKIPTLDQLLPAPEAVHAQLNEG